MKIWSVASMVACLAGHLMATEYFVEKSGDDDHPGTRMQPFRTVSHAAAIMSAGDTCTVGKGLYRECVRPRNSGKAGAPLVFRTSPGETATLSGTDDNGGWRTLPDGSFRCSATEAPARLMLDDLPAERLAHPEDRPAVGCGAAWYYDPTQAEIVVRSDGRSILAAHHVEIQSRVWGADFGNLGHVVIQGFNLLSCGINMTNSRMCRVDDCHIWWAGDAGPATCSPRPAILVGGEDNEVINSSCVGSAGGGVVLLPGSRNSVIENCLFRGRDGQHPADGYGMLVQGTAPLVRHVTVAFFSGAAMRLTNALNARIEGNDLHHCGGEPEGRGTLELAGDGRGTVVAGNWLHDNASATGCGILFAGPVENHVVRQNVIWRIRGAALRLAGPACYNFIFNQTCALNGVAIEAEPSTSPADFKETRIINNIFAGEAWSRNDGVPPPGVTWKKNYVGSAPGFVDEMNLNFKLAPGSPCIDAGQEEPEFTDEFTGALPDLGAYEVGRDYPPPGCQVNEKANRVSAPEVKILLESRTPQAELRYTLDGSEPNRASPLYTGAVSIVYGATVKSKAFRTGMEDSRTSSALVRSLE